ncbi:GFA family protein [Endozoicomonadaceae bacterium StTr2]
MLTEYCYGLALPSDEYGRIHAASRDMAVTIKFEAFSTPAKTAYPQRSTFRSETGTLIGWLKKSLPYSKSCNNQGNIAVAYEVGPDVLALGTGEPEQPVIQLYASDLSSVSAVTIPTETQSHTLFSDIYLLQLGDEKAARLHCARLTLPLQWKSTRVQLILNPGSKKIQLIQLDSDNQITAAFKQVLRRIATPRVVAGFAVKQGMALALINLEKLDESGWIALLPLDCLLATHPGSHQSSCIILPRKKGLFIYSLSATGQIKRQQIRSPRYSVNLRQQEERSNELTVTEPTPSPVPVSHAGSKRRKSQCGNGSEFHTGWDEKPDSLVKRSKKMRRAPVPLNELARLSQREPYLLAQVKQLEELLLNLGICLDDFDLGSSSSLKKHHRNLGLYLSSYSLLALGHLCDFLSPDNEYGDETVPDRLKYRVIPSGHYQSYSQWIKSVLFHLVRRSPSLYLKEQLQYEPATALEPYLLYGLLCRLFAKNNQLPLFEKWNRKVKDKYEAYLQQSYSGSCHCGNVGFNFTASTMMEGIRCSCSSCSHGAISTTSMTPFVLPREQLHISAAEDDLTFRTCTNALCRHVFCSKCNAYTFSQTDQTCDEYRVSIDCIEGVDSIALPYRYLPDCYPESDPVVEDQMESDEKE